MTDETQAVDQEQPENGQEAQNQDEKMFPLSYIQELRQENAKYRTRAKELEQQQKDAEEAQLAEQQKWQQLAEKRAADLEELSPYKARYEAMLESVAESNKRRIDSIPERMRGLVPDFDDPIKTSQWLDANAQFLSKPLAPNLNGEAGGGERPIGEPLSEEQIATARRMGISAKEYQEALASMAKARG